MKKQKTGNRNKKLAYASLILLLSLIILIQAKYVIQLTNAQSTTATNGQWALSFQIQKVGQSATGNIFTPFDQIQLTAKVTYRNATQPDILVTFKVKGPPNAANLTNIINVATTNAAGQAESVFRLPADNQNKDSSIGKWQAIATIEADNNIIQQSLSFTTRWNLQITSINTQNSQGQNQTIFYPGKTVKIKLTISNQGQPQEANITLNMIDSTGKTINQTQIQNTQVNSGSNLTQVETELQIPNSANTAEATINAAVYSGTFQNINVPAAENQTAYFTLVAKTAPTTRTPAPTPILTENSVSLFSWLLVATGLFTFTSLFMFLRRKPTPGIGTQMPNLPPTVSNPAVASPLLFPQNSQETSQKQPTQPTATPRTAPEKVINAALITQLPSIYETLDIPTPESTSPQEQKQKMVDHITKISSINQRVQTLETELKIEKEQLNKEVMDLNKTLNEQERAVKNYFDSIRQAVAALGTHPAETNEKQNLSPAEDGKQNMGQIEQSNATQNSTINTQPAQVNNKQDSNPTEVDNKQKTQQTQQNIEDKNPKET